MDLSYRVLDVLARVGDLLRRAESVAGADALAGVALVALGAVCVSAFSQPSREPAEQAEALGWPVIALELHHLALLTSPERSSTLYSS